MANLDHNIILSGKAPEFDNPLDVANKALTMKGLMQRNQQAQEERDQVKAIDSAFKNNVTVGADGTTALNRKGVMSDLWRASPQKALETEKGWAEQDAAAEKAKLEKVTRDVNLTGQLLGTVTDQASYERALAEAKALGIANVESMPPAYDPKYIRGMQERALSVGEQLAQKWKQVEFDQARQDKKEDRKHDFAKMNYKDQLDRGMSALNHGEAKELQVLQNAAAMNRLDKQGQQRMAELANKAQAKGNKAPSALNTSDKARFDNSKMGLNAIQSMDAALAGGDNTFSLVGDNDFTLNLDHAAEAFGRMQSGGAINKDEEKRFKRMAPTLNDSKKIQREKLVKMQKLFVDRLQTLGFSPEQAGVEVKDIKYGAPAADYDGMSDEELAAQYQQRVLGTKNAKSR